MASIVFASVGWAGCVIPAPQLQGPTGPAGPAGPAAGPPAGVAEPAASGAASVEPGTGVAVSASGTAGGETVSASVTTTGEPIQVRYTWRDGQTHRYDYREVANLQMTMSGMGSFGVQMNASSQYTLTVDKVYADGWADIRLGLTGFQLTMGGRPLVTIDAIPQAARSVRAAVSPHGEIVFANDVEVLLGQNSAYVVVSGTGKAQRGQVSVKASASAGRENVQVSASINFETGQMSASVSAEERQQLEGDTAGIDVFPHDLLALLVVPRDEFSTGGTVSIATPLGNTTVTAERKPDNQVAVRSVMDMDMPEVGAGMQADVTSMIALDSGLLSSASGSMSFGMRMPEFQQKLTREFTLTRSR